MKVLLLKDVPGTGRKNDIKDVNDGFARNFLFARNLAVMATDTKIQHLEREKKGREQKQEGEQKKYQDLADQVKKIEAVITTKIGEKGRAFGSIGVQEIKKAIEQQGINIDESWIELEDPIKSTGAKQIVLKFPHGVIGLVNVTIKPE